MRIWPLGRKFAQQDALPVTRRRAHDYKVLSQLDLTVLAPSIILFEHKHLASGEREKSIQHLAGHYQMFDLGSDFLAVSESRSMAFATKLQALKHQRVIP